ncbi:MAG: putative metal-dependent hydrolase [Candidatus Midichloriaceae bacterium]|jgi:predicted metal-dependent hydrolase
MMIFNAPLNKSITLQALGEPIIVSVRQSYRAKHIAIRINKNREAELVLPMSIMKYKYNLAYKFLFEREAWIRKKFQKNTYQPINENNQNKIFVILGETYHIKHIESSSNKSVVNIYDDNIIVHAPLDHSADALSKHLKEYTLQKITELVKIYAKAHGFQKYGKISVKELSSKWGSCSHKGNLSFNWRLIFAPPEILNYVLVHEICHLKEMNHSDKFWNLVKSIDPNYKTSILWLKRNGQSLYQYLPHSNKII